MQAKYLKKGSWYKCKYRTKQGYAYSNREKVQTGIAKLVKISWGFGDQCHQLELPDGSKVYCTSNGILEETTGSSNQSLLNDSMQAEYEQAIKEGKIGLLKEDIQVVAYMLEGLGVAANADLKEGAVVIPGLEAKKLEIVLKHCYVNYLEQQLEDA